MTHALELRDVTKRYVGHLAVDRLSLDVPQGCICGILGERRGEIDDAADGDEHHRPRQRRGPRAIPGTGSTSPC
jgi:hypothetical protein